MKSFIELQARATEITGELEILEGREKGDVSKLLGCTVTINGFDYMTDPNKEGDEKEYVVFTIVEDDAHFFFGGKLLTESLKQLEAEGFREIIEAKGIPTAFDKKLTKDKKKSYTVPTFFPKVVEEQPVEDVTPVDTKKKAK